LIASTLTFISMQVFSFIKNSLAGKSGS